MALLRRRDVGAEFLVRLAERSRAEEVQHFGVGQDSGLWVENLASALDKLVPGRVLETA